MVLITICVIVLALIAAALIEIRKELHTFQVTRYIAAYSKLDPLKNKKRIVFLSDLHAQQYGDHNDVLLEAVRKENPELILVGGDMMVGREPETIETALAFVRELPKIAPVYYANGNHEQRLKELKKYGSLYEDYKAELEAAGVIFLEDNTVTLDWDGVPVHITGLEIPFEEYQHFRRPEMDYAEIGRRIGSEAPEGYNILLAHNPMFIDFYKRWGADLILSGHFHGGLIRIPGIRGLIIPGIGKYKKYSGGIYLESDKRIVVSKGLGSHTIRLRLFNKAEVNSLLLEGKQSEGETL